MPGTGRGPERAAFCIRFPADRAHLHLAHEAVRRVALTEGFASDAAEQIAVAVGEAVTNVMEHAYESRSGHHVRIRCLTSVPMLRFEVEHSGKPPSVLPGPVDLEAFAAEGRRGGLGVVLMRGVMNRVFHESAGPGVGRWVLERDRPAEGGRE